MQAQVLMDRFLRNTISQQYKLSAHEKLLLFFLASYIGKNLYWEPSIKKLASDCSLSIDSVKRAIKSLEKKELIYVIRHSGKRNRYSFNLSIIDQPGAISSQCSQQPVANSPINLVLTAPTPGANSTPNNISNNKKECTSLNIREVSISPYSLSETNQSAGKEVQEVFNHWKKVMNHPHAKLDDKRRTKIKHALKLGYEVEQLKQAIGGCSLSPYHTGNNADNKRYDSIDLIFRNADKIEQFIAYSTNPPADTKSNSVTATDIMEGVCHE